MNNSIVCTECSMPNAADSKFCNSCGSRLPESEKIICSSCQTPNARDRVYCDECGTRLPHDDLPVAPDSAAESDKASSSAQAFSLPTREPGDTGDLDPSALLSRLIDDQPAVEEDDEEEESGSGSLPRIEELTPEEKATADLPEWLLSGQDSEPIIEAPHSITTDNYLDLLSESPANDLETADSADEAVLPSWLASNAETAADQPTSAEDEAADSALTGWLSALGATDDAGSPVDQVDSPVDWLSELGPPNTDILSVGTDSDFDKVGDASLGEDRLPDWMAELGSPNTDILSVPVDSDLDSNDRTTFADEQLPDWISDLGPPDTNMLSVPSDFAETLPDPSDDKLDSGSSGEEGLVDGELPDWIADLDPTSDVHSEPGEASGDDTLVASAGGATDWLVDFDAEFGDSPDIVVDEGAEQSEDTFVAGASEVAAWPQRNIETPDDATIAEAYEDDAADPDDGGSGWWADQVDSDITFLRGPEASMPEVEDDTTSVDDILGNGTATDLGEEIPGLMEDDEPEIVLMPEPEAQPPPDEFDGLEDEITLLGVETESEVLDEFTGEGTDAVQGDELSEPVLDDDEFLEPFPHVQDAAFPVDGTIALEDEITLLELEADSGDLDDILGDDTELEPSEEPFDWALDADEPQIEESPPLELAPSLADSDRPDFPTADSSPEWLSEPGLPDHAAADASDLATGSIEAADAGESEPGLPLWLTDDALTDEPDEVVDEAVDEEVVDEAADGITTDSAFDGADLPEWLTEDGLSDGADDVAVDTADEIVTDSAFDGVDLPEWLTEDGLSDEVDDVAVDTADEIVTGSAIDGVDLPEWLTEDGLSDGADDVAVDTADEIVTDSASDGVDLPEWLTEDGLSDEVDDVAVDATDEIDTDSAFDDVDLPEWLSEPGLTGVEMRAPLGDKDEDTAGVQQDDDEELVPDWLTEDVHEAGDSVGSSSDVMDESTDIWSEDERGSMPDWLREAEEQIGVEESGGGDVLSEPDVSGEGVPGTGELSEWVHDLESSGSGILGEGGESPNLPPEATSAIDEDIAGWVDELDSVDSEMTFAKGDDPDDATEGATFIAEDIPGWTSETDAPIDAAQKPPASQVDSEAAETLASWFADIEDETSRGDSERSEDSFDDLFGDEGLSQGTELPWMTAPLVDPAVEEESIIVEESVPAPVELVDQADEHEEEVEQPLSEEPDWLSELESLDATAFSEDSGGPLPTLDEMDELTGALPDHDVEMPDAVIEPEQELGLPAESELAEEQVKEQDWASLDDILDDTLVDQDVPDWLDQLGTPASERGMEDQVPEEIASAEDMPDWVADLKPSTDDEVGSLLPTALLPDLDDPTDFSDMEDELGDPALPDWLMGATSSPVDSDLLVTPAPDKSLSSGWFGMDDSKDADGFLSFADDAQVAGDESLGDLLGDLPPAVPIDEGLAKAEIPDWILQLKPRELDADDARTHVKLPEETKGPLAGMRGVIGIEPIIDVPREALSVSVFSVTKEQQQQAVLLRRLTQWEEKPTEIKMRTLGGTSIWIRIVLSTLLLAAVIAGLWLPDLFGSATMDPSDATAAVNNAIVETAGDAVLLAVDFTPAMSAELMPQVEMLLSQIDSAGGPVILASQYSAGTAIIGQLLDQRSAHDIGLIPGEAIGLRQLGECIAPENECSQLQGRVLDADMREAINEVGLVIVVTGDHSSLVNWIEQVGVTSDIPVVAGLTQTLGPLASPYVDSGQLTGAILGAQDSEAFRTAFGDGADDFDLPASLSALNLAQLLAVIVILFGGIVHGVSAGDSKRAASSKKGAATNN